MLFHIFMNYFVTTQLIRRWAQERLDARSTLPHVLRRLVHATVRSVSKVDFPAHESAQRSGFDGIIECRYGNAWVPAGRSGWELSTDKDNKGKADYDFEKRTEAVSPDEREQTAFIFVTARHWEIKSEWAATQNALGQWKEVRAYDADDIEQWLETAPAVGVWFAQLLGVRPADMDDIDHRWKAISESTTVSLKPDVFLVSRDESEKKLQDWLQSHPECLTFASRSPSEVIDFVCASFSALNEPLSSRTRARAAIVESESAWKQLRDSADGLILIVEPSVKINSVDITRAVSHGNRVLQAVTLDRHSQQKGIELEHASEFHLRQALETCGMTPVRAEQVARASAGSLAILKRRLSKYPDNYRQQWAAGARGDAIRATLLIGGWESGTLADQEAIERIGNSTYAELEADFHYLATVRDPLLLHAANNWRVISKDEGWDVLGAQVTAGSLTTFEALAINILAEDDPKYDLEQDEQFMARLRGHRPQYSSTIRKHVSENLALLGTIGSKLEAASSFNIDGSLYRIVRTVLGNDAPWTRWASLGHHLTMLAEASPDAFLEATRADLSKEEPQLIQLFKDEGHPLFGGCRHAGLLWALETLAWSPQYLLEVCKVLLTLDAHDPGGKWANRPHSSLCEILSVWTPYTTATFDQRMKVLESLIRSDEQAAWKLFTSLLPQPLGGFSTPTHRPYWREWANSWEQGVSYSELRKTIKFISEKLVILAGRNAARWQEIVSRINQLSRDTIPQAIQELRELAKINISDSERRLVSEELSEIINLHRHHEEAKWALPEAILTELESVLEKLQPKNPVLRNAWLFARWPDRFYMREGSIEDHNKAIDDARAIALREITNDSGFDGIIELCQHSDPNMVGRTVSMIAAAEYEDQIIPAMLVSEDRKINLANGFIQHRFHPDNWQWADEAYANCTNNESRAWLLALLPFSPITWQRVRSAGQDVWASYWQRCRPYGHELDETSVATAVDALIQTGRIRAAINVIVMAIHEKRKLSANTLCQPLDALLLLPEQDLKAQFGEIKSHDIGEIFSELQKCDDVDPERLITLEWQYLKFLDTRHGQPPEALHRRLSERPEFFIEVLSLCYKSQNEDDPPSPTDRDIYMARQASHLLFDWRRIPGRMDDGTINEDLFRKWCNDARRLATECGRLNVCDDRIGNMLCEAPSDSDGSWPAAPIRHVLEEIATESLASGLAMGIHNSRGVVCRAKGGKQERELVAKYTALADRVRFESPFVAGILDDVAHHYESEANYWDEQEKWEQRG
jgi:hypothetical protein